MEMKLNSAYICVKDMERAIKFYEEFLGQDIDIKDDILSVFDFKGFRLCLFCNERVNEKVTYGDNCLLSFEVDDMDELIKKLDILDVEIVFPLTKIGSNLVLEFKDIEGNDIEVYCKN